MSKKYQFINQFPSWVGFHLVKVNIQTTHLALIYHWYLFLGWFEIRRWNNDGWEKKEKLLKEE